MGHIKQNRQRSVLWLAIAIAAIVFSVIPRQSLGKDVSSMYREDDLNRLRKRYSKDIGLNFEDVIKPVLTKRERAALQNVQLEYPLIGEGGDPFGYYINVERERWRIVIPTASIKFLDDLSTAEAWLQSKKYSTETLPKYISMLKYQEANRFPGGRYPTPLEALHIPPNVVRTDRAVNELAQKLFKSTVIYLVSRELGFLYFSRPYIRKNQMKQMKGLGMERRDLILKSDAFALEIMRRIGVPPDSLSFYLSAQTYWTPRHEYSLLSKRLYHISNMMATGKEDYTRKQTDRHTSSLQIERAAREIFRLIDILQNESEQRRIEQEALKQRVDSLKPSRR